MNIHSVAGWMSTVAATPAGQDGLPLKTLDADPQQKRALSDAGSRARRAAAPSGPTMKSAHQLRDEDGRDRQDQQRAVSCCAERGSLRARRDDHRHLQRGQLDERAEHAEQDQQPRPDDRPPHAGLADRDDAPRRRAPTASHVRPSANRNGVSVFAASSSMRRDRRGQQRLERLRLASRRSRRASPAPWPPRSAPAAAATRTGETGRPGSTRCRTGRPAPESPRPRCAASSANSPDSSSVSPAIIGATDDDEERREERAEHHHDGGQDGAGIAHQLARVLARERAMTRCQEKPSVTRSAPTRSRYTSSSDRRSGVDAHDPRALGNEPRDDRGNLRRGPRSANSRRSPPSSSIDTRLPAPRLRSVAGVSNASSSVFSIAMRSDELLGFGEVVRGDQHGAALGPQSRGSDRECGARWPDRGPTSARRAAAPAAR